MSRLRDDRPRGDLGGILPARFPGVDLLRLAQPPSLPPACAIIRAMPQPKTGRDAWTEELNDLLALIASYQRELDAAPATATERRERLQWQIRRGEKRLAEIEARLRQVAR